MPIKRRTKLKKNEDQWCWVNFEYEVVPTFCFICGVIGHSDKFYEKLFDTPMELIQRPYGPWIRAEPRRRNHIIEAKWLRPGGSLPVATIEETYEPKSGKVGKGKSG